MASARGPVVARRKRQTTARENKEVRPQGVSKKEPQRRLRSASAQRIQQLQKDTTSRHLRSGEEENCLNPPKTRKRRREPATDKRPDTRPRKRPQRLSPTKQPKDRKRPREDFDPQTSAEAPRKRARRSLRSPTVDSIVNQEAAINVGEEEIDPIDYWRLTNRWPKEYAEQSDDNMSHLLARKKSSSSLRRKQSGPASDTPSSNTPSDQKPREAKSAPYQDPRYKLLLSTKGSFMNESDLGITEKSKKTYLNLLKAKQTVPSDSLFRDDIFKRTCQKIQDRNETRVIRDISLLIVPSAEILATYGAEHLNILIDSTNEGWNNSIPLTGTRPQPDYSVGFKREAFTKDQLDKLSPFIGDFIAGDQSFFMATYYMYFPFLTCEVKCGAAALDIADRQNAHSMTLAVRAIVELFRLVGREMELHREILAFSISHDHRSVRIYGQYPVIKGKDITYYRHPIHTFDFTALDGKDKWTAYKFTKNVYDTWMPAHFKRLCSVIDKLPANLDFSVPQLPEGSGLSQVFESHRLSESTEPGPGGTTPDTSFTGQEGPRKRRAAG